MCCILNDFIQEDAESDISIVWSDEVEDDDDGILTGEDQEENMSDEVGVVEGQDSRFIVLMCRLVFLWQVIHGLSERVIHGLLCILSAFFKEIAKSYPALLNVSINFPSSLYLFRKWTGSNRDNFSKFTMCPKCSKLYTYDEINGPSRIIKCTNSWLIQSLPRRVLEKCNAKLVKEVHMANGKIRIYPLKTFCYNSIIEALKVMIQREKFLEKCNNWKSRVSPPGIMTDVYDGKIWKSLFGDEGPFSGPNHLAFLINVDWFQPYKRRSTSIGAIYLTLLNLPREERYKRENIIVVGIIPSLGDGGEPPSLNMLIEPLVEDLKRLFVGVEFETSQKTNVTCYGLLIGCSSDIPANKKLCGFLSHSAHKGCSRCLKNFPSIRIGNHSKINYSGFEDTLWEKRTNEDHRQKAKDICKAQSKREKEKLEKENGLRYSKLLDLPYYDAIKFCLIDPMHNLFLGTSKKMFTLWLEKDILGPNSLKNLKQSIQNVKVPADVGRIPSNIESNYSRFTAEEWKNWTLYYSLFVLRHVLPDAHFNCWQKFVLACTFICSPYITENDVKRANILFIRFGKKVEQLYGAKVVTPNMHFHAHLAECVEDFGPVQTFWCFAFERFNGLITDIPTNHHSIELQYMRSILNWSFAGFYHKTDMSQNDEVVDAVLRSVQKPVVFCNAIPLVPSWSGIITVDTIQDLSTVTLSGRSENHGLTKDDMILLRQMYSFFYQDIGLESLAQTCYRYRSIKVGQERFGSIADKRSSKSSNIVAVWCGPNGEVLDAHEASISKLRPGKIKYFLDHSVKFNDQYYKHTVACVSWYNDYEKADSTMNLKPISEWSEKLVSPGPACFIPVQRILGKCIVLTNTLEKRVCICPLQRKL